MKQVCSMMAGVVIEILVKQGDAVEDGMDVAILESMKMEIPVLASDDGTVAEVMVEEEEPVAEGQVVIVLDA